MIWHVKRFLKDEIMSYSLKGEASEKKNWYKILITTYNEHTELNAINVIYKAKSFSICVKLILFNNKKDKINIVLGV